MIIEERKNHELNLESIDRDLRMENVRQSAEKLGWEHFSKSVRKNLQEKRHTLEASVRLDVLESLAFMKEHIPIAKDASIFHKIQHLADGIGENCTIITHNSGVYLKHADVTLEIGITADNVIVSCKIGYFGQPLFEAPKALELMKNGEFAEVRDSIARVLSSLPKGITMNDKAACKDAFRALEHVLKRDASDSTFNAINTNKYGFYSPRTDLLPGRIYFVADPVLTKLAENEGKTEPDNSYLELLPYFEISFVKHDKKCQLPVFSETGESTTFNEANVCICIRFNQAFLFSHLTIRKLARMVPKAPLVRSYVNFYRYIAGRGATKNNIKMMTQFPEESDIQQQYDVDASKLRREDDAVVVEMFLSDLRDLPKLIEVLRCEWMHASLWESILAMCEPKQGVAQKEVQAVNMQIVPRRDAFELQFDTEYGYMMVIMSEKSSGQYSVETKSLLFGVSPCVELDNSSTVKLNSTWNIPIMLFSAISNLNPRLVKVLSPLLNCANAFVTDKRQNSLWAANNNTRQTVVAEPKKRNTVMVLELGPAIIPNEVVFTRENDEELRGGLLSSFGEVDQYYVETSTIGKTRAQPRPKREQNQLTSMGMMSAELDKGRQQFEMRQQQDMQRMHGAHMSALESARVHMKQSIGAAHAVGLASHQPHALGPMRHHSYTMGFDSPAPYDPNIPANIQFPDPAQFGKKQRKPRTKKQPGEEGAAPSGRGKGRRGRGAASVAGNTGGRKSTGVVPENPYGMDPMRPTLQRSFSDFPGQMNPQQMSQYQQMQHMQQMQQFQQNQHYQQSQQYRMQMHQHQLAQQQQMQQQQMQSPGFNTPKQPPNYTDEDSVADEECDPPPPPKQVSAASRASSAVPTPPHQLGNPMIGYPGMPLQSPNHLPLTPSPLSAPPPKPFSPELQQQQHYGMRTPAYWKEADRIEMKPDVEKLKQQMAAAAASQNTASTSSSTEGPSSSSNTEATKPPAPTPKKKLGLEAAISKIRGQQEQALQKQLRGQGSVDSIGSEQPTPQPFEQQGMLPPLLPHQVNRARNLNDVFDDETEDSNANRDVKPSLSALQRALSTSIASDSTATPAPAMMANLKREAVEEEPEKEKLIVKLKIPKMLRPPMPEDRRDDRKEKDRDGDRDRDRERREKSKEREKDKKEREKEKKRQRERDRADSKKSDKDPGTSKEKEPSSKKRKLDKEKDRREPDRKKGKTDETVGKTPATTMPTNFSLRNFRIPKKDTVDEEKKEEKKEEPVQPGPSAPPEPRKETPSAAPISRKESTSAVAPSLQRKESFTTQPVSSFPQDLHIPKKKTLTPVIMPSVGIYQPPSNQGPPMMPNNMRGGNNGGMGNRKPPMAPPPQMMSYRGPPPEQMYRDRAGGGMRGFPPSGHYHGGGGVGSGINKQVASYAQGLPPGMGPPAVKPHGNNYQASQWVRPPTHRDQSHSYHGMPPIGPTQQQLLQREPPPPPPQMIPLPREPPREPPREQPREQAPPPPPPPAQAPRERTRGDGSGPDSPEDTLRIDDE